MTFTSQICKLWQEFIDFEFIKRQKTTLSKLNIGSHVSCILVHYQPLEILDWTNMYQFYATFREGPRLSYMEILHDFHVFKNQDVQFLLRTNWNSEPIFKSYE